MFPCKEIDQMPDVFMYLTYDDKHVCFYRFKAKELIDVNVDDEYYKMKRDAAINKVENKYEAGYIRVRLYANKLGMHPDLTEGN